MSAAVSVLHSMSQLPECACMLELHFCVSWESPWSGQSNLTLATELCFCSLLGKKQLLMVFAFRKHLCGAKTYKGNVQAV